MLIIIAVSHAEGNAHGRPENATDYNTCQPLFGATLGLHFCRHLFPANRARNRDRSSWEYCRQGLKMVVVIDNNCGLLWWLWHAHHHWRWHTHHHRLRLHHHWLGLHHHWLAPHHWLAHHWLALHHHRLRRLHHHRLSVHF